jgi:hypothetical protein
MNFLAGIIFTAVNEEVAAFAIMQRIMQSKAMAVMIQSELPDEIKFSAHALRCQPEWRFVYSDGMKKLNAFVDEIKQWLCETRRILYIHFESRKIILEALLSNPILSLFSNVIPNQHALKVLDRFLHFGQKSLIQILKNILSRQ